MRYWIRHKEAHWRNERFGLNTLIASTYLSVIDASTKWSTFCWIMGIMRTVCFDFPAVDTAASGTCCPHSPSNKQVKASEIQQTKKYPTTSHPDVPLHSLYWGMPIRFLKPAQLDFEWMLCAIRYAAHNVLYYGWSKGQMKAFVNSCAVPNWVTKKIYNWFHAMDIAYDTGGDAVESDECMPKVWLSTVNMSAWIDAGMHHIFSWGCS